MLKDYVAESCSAPGTGTFNLAGALPGRVPFAVNFANAGVCYYYATDGTNFECGIGTLTYGTPNTLARTTVLNNSAGTTALINFTGTITVYNDVPASKTVSLDLFATASSSSAGSYGITEVRLPDGTRMFYGVAITSSAGSSVAINYPLGAMINPPFVALGNSGATVGGIPSDSTATATTSGFFIEASAGYSGAGVATSVSFIGMGK